MCAVQTCVQQAQQHLHPVLQIQIPKPASTSLLLAQPFQWTPHAQISQVITCVVDTYNACLPRLHLLCSNRFCHSAEQTSNQILNTYQFACYTAGECPGGQECNAQNSDAAAAAGYSTLTGVCVTPKAAGAACTVGHGKDALLAPFLMPDVSAHPDQRHCDSYGQSDGVSLCAFAVCLYQQGCSCTCFLLCHAKQTPTHETL